MPSRYPLQNLFASMLAIVLLANTSNVAATIVEIQTTEGSFQINLFDNDTPATVANFLNYVNNGAYSSAIVHRSVPGFVAQGGGFAFDTVAPPLTIPTNPPVANEPVFSNVRGTIAMAKLGGNPDSATNQWFINLVDNSSDLDGQNGGFTAFGQVIGSGMDVVDAVSALPRFNFSAAFGAAFGELPLQNFSQADATNGVQPDDTNFVIINAIIISDSTVDSAAGLNPAPNNANNGGNPPPPDNSGGGGGSPAVGTLLILAGAALLRRRILLRFRNSTT